MWKPFVGCLLAGGLAFLFMGLQTGMFGSNRSADDDEEGVEAVADGGTPRKAEKKPEKKEPETPPAKFPEDLAGAARAQPVTKAGSYRAGERVHKMVFLRPNG